MGQNEPPKKSQKKATIYDVAKHAKVSPGTVSRALNNSGYVKADTQKKIMKAVKQLNFIPNRAGQVLKTAKTNTILLAIPDISNVIFVPMVESVLNVANEHGYSVMLYYTNAEEEKEIGVVRMLRENIVDGLLLVHFSYSQELRNEIDEAGVPIVLFPLCESRWGGVSDNSFDLVLLDVYDGIYEMVDYVAKEGFRRIGYLAGKYKQDVYRQRYDAYKKALEDNGIPFDEALVYGEDYSEESGYAAARYFSKMKKMPEVVCASNDTQAIGFWRGCKDLGLRIPEDIALTGFDNNEMTELLEITSMKIYEDQMGEDGTRLLFKRLEGGGGSTASSTYYFRPKLIIRNSSNRKKQKESRR